MTLETTDLTVRYYQVMEERMDRDTGARTHGPVGPMFETREQGRAYLQNIQAAHPDAHLVQAEWYFDSASDTERQEMLEHIIPAQE